MARADRGKSADETVPQNPAVTVWRQNFSAKNFGVDNWCATAPALRRLTVPSC